MRKNRVFLLSCLLFLPAPCVFADIAAIHAELLPQETAVLAALDDAKQLEPFCSSWTSDWNYLITKEEVTTRLSKDLGFLSLALKNHPDNSELALLTGLVARYAYNLDVTGSHKTAASALDQAEKLAPSDYRGPWFRATLECEINEVKPGADKFLTIETSHSEDPLPASFWDDYIECAYLADMPAHVLRAADRLQEMRAPDSERRNAIVGFARKRFDPFDPKRTYELREAWRAEGKGEEPAFTSTMCGVRLHAKGSWQVNQLALDKGSCIAYFSTGPYQATLNSLHPSVLMLVQRPKEGETLQDYSKKFLKNGTFAPDRAIHCPIANCIALKGLQPGMYSADGDGHSRIVFFERDEPVFPGLVFESPLSLPASKASGPVAYHPSQIQQRIPGKLYYLVTLDTAASIEEPAMKDFDYFLQNLTVE